MERIEIMFYTMMLGSKVDSNEAIRSISLYGYNEREVELYKRKIQKQRTEKEKTWQIRKEKSLIL